MLAESSQMLNDMGFKESPKMGVPGDYAIERAFVERQTPMLHKNGK